MSGYKLDGTGTIARIKFGANDREWLITGKDSDNTLALLSTTSIGNKEYGGNSKYSASTVKNLLDSDTSDTTYFSTEEKELMKDTTVSTLEYDQGDEEIARTTTGKLYLANTQNRDSNGATTIYVGSGNNIPISLSNLTISNGFAAYYFWLRSPYLINDNIALGASSGDTVTKREVFIWGEVVPACDLNMSSVIFASAANVASSSNVASSEGSLSVSDAMTLRYASTSLGGATFNPSGTSVAVAGAPSGNRIATSN